MTKIRSQENCFTTNGRVIPNSEVQMTFKRTKKGRFGKDTKI